MIAIAIAALMWKFLKKSPAAKLGRATAAAGAS